MRYDPQSGYYGIDLRLTTKPDYKILIGGNISSTAFNQAYIGFESQRIRRAANRYYTHLFLGPVSSAVMLGGRTDFFLWRPLFVDYSYNFTARNYKNGNFGNLTSVSNTAVDEVSGELPLAGVRIPRHAPQRRGAARQRRAGTLLLQSLAATPTRRATTRI